jgi:hypothetical protein
MTNTSAVAIDQVNDLIFGRWKSRVLYTGVLLGIFDLLKSGPRVAPDICRALNLDERMGYRLLRALASIGLLTEGRGELKTASFALTSQGECLCAGHPSNLRDVSLLQDGPEHTAIWKHLPDMIREGWQNAFRREYGASAFDYADSHAEYSRVFDAAMASYSAQQAAAAVDALRDFDFREAETVCDIGGGRGTLLNALLKSHQKLRGVVLERPAVIAQAEGLIDRTPAAGEWCYHAGDMFQFVPPADLYLLKLILHDWDDEQCVQLLKNIRLAALESGRAQARLLILEFVITPPDEPHFSKLYDIHMMCWGQGRERSALQYEELLSAAGWQAGKLRPMPSVEMGIIEARLK